MTKRKKNEWVVYPEIPITIDELKQNLMVERDGGTTVPTTEELNNGFNNFNEPSEEYQKKMMDGLLRPTHKSTKTYGTAYRKKRQAKNKAQRKSRRQNRR